MEAKTLALYLGCETNLGTLITVKLDEAITSSKLGGYVNVTDFSQLKLLLRPLSSMTEEEKKEYNKRKQRKGFMAEVHAENTLWLISKGFDVFFLIPDGKAIDSTKL